MAHFLARQVGTQAATRYAHIASNHTVKWKLCITAVLVAMMVTASLDAVPDPPAVNPHKVSIVSPLCEARGAMCKQHLDSHSLCSSSHHLQISWIAFTSAYVPNLPNDWIVLTGQASDSISPGSRSYAPALLLTRLVVVPSRDVFRRQNENRHEECRNYSRLAQDS